MKKVLIIDDERAICSSLADLLEDFGYDAEFAEDGATGLEMALKEHFDAIMCDIKMPGMSGIEVLEALKDKGVDSPMIMISGHADIETAVECIRKGAFDFIEKPLGQHFSHIQITLKNATETGILIKETKALKKRIYGQEMIGESAPMQQVRDIIDKVAPTDARVLITGSNGTGKELVARNLHLKSRRSSQPYVEVNCAAIPSELIESELFGHEKGAFTSAVKQHKGKFEQAEGGTLFLDEIGDMSLAAQAKVLRALQEKKICRVGSDKDINVDVRVIAATNKNLLEEIAQKRFREDLYHRLSVIVVHVPSLDERRDDIPLLIAYFIDRICSETGMPKREMDEDAVRLLKDKHWSGNIRELRNVVERLLILSGSRITAADVRSYVL